MTNTELSLENVFKSKAAFEDYITNNPMPVDICRVMTNYPQKETVLLTELTQTTDSLFNKVGEDNFNLNQYLVWVVTNPKDKIVNTVSNLNGKGKLEVFIFKASLNEDCPEFECLLKPDLKEKKKRITNTETTVKLLQQEYWKLYRQECDLSEYPDMQIAENDIKPRHYQNISIYNVSNVRLRPTVNMRDQFVGAELYLSKEKYETLFEHKAEIEKSIGELIWDNKDTNQTATVRKIYPIDVNDSKNFKKAIEHHLKIGNDLKEIAQQYLSTTGA